MYIVGICALYFPAFSHIQLCQFYKFTIFGNKDVLFLQLPVKGAFSSVWDFQMEFIRIWLGKGDYLQSYKRCWQKDGEEKTYVFEVLWLLRSLLAEANSKWMDGHSKYSYIGGVSVSLSLFGQMLAELTVFKWVDFMGWIGRRDTICDFLHFFFINYEIFWVFLFVVVEMGKKTILFWVKSYRLV